MSHMLQDIQLHAVTSLTNELTLLKATLILGARKRLIYRLTFDEFHRVAVSDGHKIIDCIQFLWGLHQRSTLLREDGGRPA